MGEAVEYDRQAYPGTSPKGLLRARSGSNHPPPLSYDDSPSLGSSSNKQGCPFLPLPTPLSLQSEYDRFIEDPIKTTKTRTNTIAPNETGQQKTTFLLFIEVGWGQTPWIQLLSNYTEDRRN